MKDTGRKTAEEVLKELFGSGIHIAGRSRLSGGDINEAFRLVLSDGRAVFMKQNASRPASFFEAEAEGLRALAAAGEIRVPEVYGTGEDPSGGAFLILEYITPERPSGDFWERFGRALARLHAAGTGEVFPEKTYGFLKNNYIGETVQVNTGKDSWVDFYRECRLAVQLGAADRYFDAKTRKAAVSLLDRLDCWIEEPAFPSLLHGDLWGGNAMCGRGGEPVLIDPAVYVGHAETDLAMTELFGGFPQAFYRAYGEVSPIPEGYRERRDLYQLYHLLNHLNLFGTAYLGAVKRILIRYGA